MLLGRKARRAVDSAGSRLDGSIGLAARLLPQIILSFAKTAKSFGSLARPADEQELVPTGYPFAACGSTLGFSDGIVLSIQAR